MDGRGARSGAKAFQRSRESCSGFGQDREFNLQECLPESCHPRDDGTARRQI